MREEFLIPIKESIKCFLKTSLHNVAFLNNYKKSINENMHVPLTNEIINFLEREKQYTSDLDLNLYVLQIKMLLHNDKKYFDILKDMLLNKDLPVWHISNIIHNLQWFCTSRLLEGEDYRREEFEIAKLRLKYDQFLFGSKIPVDVFYKFFMLAIAVSEIDWAKDFVNKYSKFLDERYQNNAISYSTARLYYQNREYDKALKEISNIRNYSFIHYKPAVKILQMMIYYELNLISEAEDIANTFVQFLRNNHLITTDIKKAYQYFLRTYMKLIKIDSIYSEKKLNDLRYDAFNEGKFLIARKWFQNQADAIKNKTSRSLGNY